MIEKIKLPAQEWLGYDPEKGDLHGYTFEQMREFAELIVKECINCYSPDDSATDWADKMRRMMERPTDAELERRTGEPHIDGYPLQSLLPPPAKEKS